MRHKTIKRGSRAREWLNPQGNNIDSLAAGQNGEIKFMASAPMAMRGQERSKFCDIRYVYDDPTGGPQVEVTKISFIEIAPEPE